MTWNPVAIGLAVWLALIVLAIACWGLYNHVTREED